MWTPEGKRQIQLTLFRRQIKDPDQPVVKTDDKPKKGTGRKRFLLRKGDV